MLMLRIRIPNSWRGRDSGGSADKQVLTGDKCGVVVPGEELRVQPRLSDWPYSDTDLGRVSYDLSRASPLSHRSARHSRLSP